MFHPAPPDAATKERLAAFAFGGGIEAPRLDEMTRLVRPATLSKGEVIVEAGSACQALVFVERGAIRVHKQMRPGREISLYRVDPGETCVLALAGILGGTPYPATATVLEDLTGLVLSAGEFLRLFELEPAIRRFVFGVFSSRLSTLMALVEEVAFHRLDRRLARLLLNEAKVASGLTKPVRRTHAELAGELGTSREVVTRMLQSFESDGVVELARGTVRVVDPEGLEGWLE